MITKGLEDYIELIYNSVLSNKTLKAVDIAKKFNISRSSVSEALIRLMDLDLIIYEGRKGIKITEKGAIEAQKVINKHKILYTFFKDILGLNDSQSAKNACEIEHVADNEAIEKINFFNNFCIQNNIHQKFIESSSDD